MIIIPINIIYYLDYYAGFFFFFYINRLLKRVFPKDKQTNIGKHHPLKV